MENNTNNYGYKGGFSFNRAITGIYTAQSVEELERTFKCSCNRCMKAKCTDGRPCRVQSAYNDRKLYLAALPDITHPDKRVLNPKRKYNIDKENMYRRPAYRMLKKFEGETILTNELRTLIDNRQYAEAAKILATAAVLYNKLTELEEMKDGN